MSAPRPTCPASPNVCAMFAAIVFPPGSRMWMLIVSLADGSPAEIKERTGTADAERAFLQLVTEHAGKHARRELEADR